MMLDHAITVGDVLAAMGSGLLACIIFLAVGVYGFAQGWW